MELKGFNTFLKDFHNEIEKIEKSISKNMNDPNITEKIRADLGENMLKSELDGPTPLRNTPKEAEDESINHTFEKLEKTIVAINNRINKMLKS